MGESLKTEHNRTCLFCGTLLPGSSNLCPVCALRAALHADVTATESVPNQSIESLFGNYKLLTHEDRTLFELGRGGMGVTYKAFDIDLRRLAAVKIIGPKYLGDHSAQLRFLREARAAASVRHPNVASVFHLGTGNGNYFYAMEFVEGETVSNLIKRVGKLEVQVAIDITRQVAAGLDAIYKAGLVHRDLKPSNIMVTLEQDKVAQAKIIDLGLAKGASIEDDAISGISVQGIFVGTPAYASPEQLSGLGADIRSDLYSLGVTLWEMLSGQLPFRGSITELYYQHQHSLAPVEELTQIPQPLRALLEVLLAKDPSKRFQTPVEILTAISIVSELLRSRGGVTADQLRLKATQSEKGANASKHSPQPVLFGATGHDIKWLLPAAIGVAGVVVFLLVIFAYRWLLPEEQNLRSKTTDRSVAVLPFDSLSENKNDAYFADGMQDEILNNLARIAQLKVISRTSVMQYRGDYKRDLRQIANSLGVANVLEGTVRRDGNHVRVSTELVDARNDHTIWADTFDRNLSDIFAIQSEIAQEVASRLSAQLSSEEMKDIADKPTTNMEAYDLYLQAKQLSNSVVLAGKTKETQLKVISLLEKATQKDPQFALAYCMIAKANDILYYEELDRTLARRALGDAAVNEASRLRPDLGDVHLAIAFHAYTCYQDYERARVQIAMAAKASPNSPVVLNLAALIDQVQGNWEKATAALEKAVPLDPRNPDLLDDLASNYWWRRRYEDYDRVIDRLIELEPDQPSFLLRKADSAFAEKAAELARVRAAYDSLPSPIKDDREMTFYRLYYATCARDFANAIQIVNSSPNAELYFGGAIVPRQILLLWTEFLQGNHPTAEYFAAARQELYQKVEANPGDPKLLSALALADVALGHNEQSIQEAQRAMEICPISEDAFQGSIIATNAALVYAWANQTDKAFEKLDELVQLASFRLTYGDLNTHPGWDPLRKDPRFEKLLARLAPHE